MKERISDFLYLIGSIFMGIVAFSTSFAILFLKIAGISFLILIIFNPNLANAIFVEESNAKEFLTIASMVSLAIVTLNMLYKLFLSSEAS